MTDQFEPAYRTLVVACKSDKRWFDLDAVRQPGNSFDRVQGPNGTGKKSEMVAERGETHALTTPHDLITNPAGAPPLDYWLLDTQDGVDRVLKSMTPKRVCRVCGEPRRRITETLGYVNREGKPAPPDFNAARIKAGVNQWESLGASAERHKVFETLGWTDCDCRCGGCQHCTEDPNPVDECIGKWREGEVLDPFDLGSEVGQARYIIADVFEALESLPDNSVDLVFSSPPFLALRSYLPADHPLKDREIGSEATPADFLDTLLDVVEACDRVLAPHGSLCFELGDTFAGSGGAGGDYAEGGFHDGQPVFKQKNNRFNQPDGESRTGPGRTTTGHPGWPLPKSLCGIPTLFAWSLAYGRNLLRPERTTPRWRIRNVVVWARPNPPVGALGDKFRPATSYLTVACKSDKRWFDLDAVRSEPMRADNNRLNTKQAETGARGDDGQVFYNNGNPAGAPPLDYWEIPTSPYSGAVRGDTVYTASQDCPEHSLRALRRNLQTVSGDELRVALERNSRRTDAGLDLKQPCERFASSDLDSPDVRREMLDWLNLAIRSQPTTGSNGASKTPTPPTGGTPSGVARTAARTSGTQAQRASSDQTTETLGLEYEPSATPRSTASRRTDPAPETTSPGTPSARTPGGTEHTSTSPASSEPGGNTSDNRTSGPPPAETGPGTESHIADTFARRCSCKQHTESTSHYATFPPRLVVKPVKAMCPSKVCRVCGEPSRRITEPTAEYANRPNAGDFLGTEHDRGKGMAARTERRPGSDPSRNGVQNVTLGWTDCECACICDDSSSFDVVAKCPVQHSLGFTSKWRNGVVLDPFAGSGTTLAVATGHGRDAIGIDLDSRNAELALERVGPLFLSVETLEDTKPFAPPAEDVESDVF